MSCARWVARALVVCLSHGTVAHAQLAGGAAPAPEEAPETDPDEPAAEEAPVALPDPPAAAPDQPTAEPDAPPEPAAQAEQLPEPASTPTSAPATRPAPVRGWPAPRPLAPATRLRAAKPAPAIEGESASEAQSASHRALSAKPKPATQEAAQRLTDDTAHTLDSGRLRLGLWKFQYGLFDFLTVGTFTLPWSVLAANLQLKLRFLEAGPFALAAQAAFGYFDSTRVRWLDQSIGNAVIWVAPVEALFSFRTGDTLTLSASAVYTEVAVDGALSLQAFEGAGQGASDNFQLTATAELRLSRAVALIVHGRWLMLQRVAASEQAILYPDAFTTVRVNSDASADDFGVQDGFSIVPSVLLSLGVFNLRAGLGYGNFNVPVLNFVLPGRTLIPELDLYLLF